jgi:hypothetical protein
MPFRRDLATFLAAHDLDPDRCDLFVEGEEDRRVLLWLAADVVNPGAVVTAVEHVDVEDVPLGGNRERLMEIARRLEDEDACILCFADAGLDEAVEHSLAKLVTTDGPDIESYVLETECVEKFLRLGLRSDAWDSARLLEIALSRGRRLGIIRITSQRQGWDLPFRRTEVKKHVRVRSGQDIEVDERAFLGVLLQNADISLAEIDDVIERCDEIETEFDAVDDRALTHGKDVFELFGEVARSEGRNRQEARSLLWTCLERPMIAGYEELGRVLRFLEVCCTDAASAAS